MYWAYDRRHLVIAQPDRVSILMQVQRRWADMYNGLASDVLPKLFKHDKIASFARQLNVSILYKLSVENKRYADIMFTLPTDLRLLKTVSRSAI